MSRGFSWDSLADRSLVHVTSHPSTGSLVPMREVGLPRE